MDSRGDVPGRRDPSIAWIGHIPMRADLPPTGWQCQAECENGSKGGDVVSPIVASVMVGLMTTLGRWARGKGLTVDTVVGVAVLAVTLAIIEQGNEKLARGFGLLVVLGVALVHAGPILDATGLTKGKTE